MLYKKESSEKAVLVISGKILEKPFDLTSISPLLNAIEKSLSERDVLLTRRIVALSKERAVAAPDFVNAGFDATPAENEDMQTAAIMLDCLASENPSTLVFALGEKEPVSFLRLLAGKTRRVLLTTEPLDNDELLRHLEGVLDVNELLNREGYDPAKFNPVAWSERSFKQEGATNQTRVLELPLQTVKFNDGETLPKRAEDDPYEALKANANAWNDALEKILLENNKKYDAAQAIARLNESFQGIYSLYWERRNKLRKLLDETRIRLLEEDGAPATFYHATHDSMDSVVTVDRLTFSGARAPDNDGDEQEYDTLDSNLAASCPRFKYAADSFEELTVDADYFRRQCEWSADRLEIMAYGDYDYKLDIVPGDKELNAINEQLRLYRWQINTFYNADMTVDDFRQFAKLYKVLSEAFELLVKIKEDRQRLEPSFVVNCLQIAADAQCLLKTTLQEFNIPIEKDPVQRGAFQLLTMFRKERYPTWTLSHMRMEDSFHLEKLPALEERLLNCRQEFEKRIESSQKIEKEIGKLKFLCNKLRDEKPQNNYEFDLFYATWNSVVEKVTNLCKNGVPYSSVELRIVLSDVIWEIPDEIEITEEFARVRREIDLVAMLEEERYISVCDTKADSNEVRAVRNRYKGRKLVFVGGAPTPHVRKRLENAFGAEILWSEFDHGDSLDRFNSLINDPDVKLLMVYIPWCSHAQSRDLKYRVERVGKEFVRLTKGTSPDQIANSICDQLHLDVGVTSEDDMEALGDD